METIYNLNSYEDQLETKHRRNSSLQSSSLSNHVKFDPETLRNIELMDNYDECKKNSDQVFFPSYFDD
jgi:hypothetical protein